MDPRCSATGLAHVARSMALKSFDMYDSEHNRVSLRRRRISENVGLISGSLRCRPPF